MKNVRKLLLLLIVMLLAVSLFACGDQTKCQNHADTDGDGLCEECGKAAESTGGISDLTLVKEGEVKFQIVYSPDAGVDVRLALNNLVKDFKDADLTLVVKEAGTETEQECEVLIGEIYNRDEKYLIDGHDYGMDGYAIKIIDKKVVIAGGSEDALAEALEIFIEDVLKPEDLEINSLVTMKEGDQQEYKQDDYDITSISVGDNDISDYVIATNLSNVLYRTQANELQANLYKNAGIWLEVVNVSEATDKSIIIRHAEKDDTGEDSFRIYCDGDNLIVECEYDNRLVENFSSFVANTFTKGEGDIKLSGKVYTKDISFVTYEQFGAKGDGKTNDFAAIKAAHDFANECGQRVLGKKSSTYYISDTRTEDEDKRLTVKTISIKTETDWQGANFIIDDTNYSTFDGTFIYSKNIFTVESDYEKEYAKPSQIAALNDIIKNGEGIGPHTTNIDLELDYPAMLVIYNKNHRVYIRYGGNANDGSYQHELVLVDKDGNIDPTTNLLLDYDEITSVEIIRADVEPITVGNATFTTMSSRVDTTVEDESGKIIQTYSTYFKRGLAVNRSNTVVYEIEHVVKGEPTVEEHQEDGLTGPPYSGFFSGSEANNITFRDLILCGRRYYKIAGTYGFGATLVNNVTLENCEQSNFYLEDGQTLSTTGYMIPRRDGTDNTMSCTTYWGLGGTNYCKNMNYINVKATRFDAHAGLYNGKIINSEIDMINLIGGGTMLIENSTLHDTKAFTLRTDYGATWNGVIIMKDCTVVSNPSSGSYNICSMVWTNHNFGYTCHFPSVIVDNLSFTGNVNLVSLVTTGDTSDPEQETLESNQQLHVPGSVVHESSNVNINPLTPPEFIIAVNKNGMPYNLVNNPLFSNTKVRGFEVDGKLDETVEYDATVDTEYDHWYELSQRESKVYIP